jgi:hypothetical protein
MGGLERAAGSLVRGVSRIGWLRKFLLLPVIARPGYWFATMCGFVWGAILGRFHIKREGGVIVASHLPSWAFGRGGTTIGAVYLTSTNVNPRILRHEAVHRSQWKKYGLSYIPLYVAAGQDALRNRFEVEAGLEDGGYRRATTR